MVVTTTSKQLLSTRKMLVELMLAAHDQQCTTCPKSVDCKLQSIAKDLGITKVRFEQGDRADTFDDSSTSIVRDTAKCVLCGNCVRQCSEIQGVGALSFAYRGSNAKVLTEFNRDMGGTDCVGCGQCVKVCPVGALMAKSNIEDVINALDDKTKTVVVQVAPAVRVALGEAFGLPAGTATMPKIISALRRMGFDRVYDTSFAADLTVVEEGKEFIARKTKGGVLPLFTSCCPAWVKYAEQFFPEMLNNLSSCRSPQQMFGALVKDKMGKDTVVVSVMPCTAKKFEAARPEHAGDVDFVITTGELAQMIKMGGINFHKLPDSDFDAPYGEATGAGIIFGASGGVSEAVLRWAASQLDKTGNYEFKQFRGGKGVNISEIAIGKTVLKLAVVSGLANAKILMEKIKSGDAKVDLVEVMACCGGCVNGGGQPVGCGDCTTKKRSDGLYNLDMGCRGKVSDTNCAVTEVYKTISPDKAHKLLHTKYKSRKKIIKK
jgi:NADH-quinone oxidoreductase subunit G